MSIKPDSITDFGKMSQLLKDAKSVIIVGHIRPDGDSIGSGMALKYALEKMGKTIVDVCFDDDIPNNFAYLNEFDHIKDKTFIDNHPWSNYDLLIVVDSSSEDRIGRCTQLREHAKKVLVIDHHQTTTVLGDVVVTNSKRVSIGAILYEYFIDNKIEITPAIATAIYTSMATDTGCFVQANTTGYAHSIAADLIEKGIDLETINYNNFKLYDRNIIPGLAYALRNMKFFANGEIAVISTPYGIMKKYGLSGELNQFKKFASEADGVKIGIIIVERKKNEFSISLRSHGNMNVAKVAEYFGGGGHKNASGFTVIGKRKKIMDEILEQVTKCLMVS